MNLPLRSCPPPNRLLLAVLASLALVGGIAGCAAPAQPEQALTPLPDRYPELPGAGLSAAAALPTLDWTELIADPDLQRLQQAALAYNSDLRVAAMRVEEARAAAGLQRATTLPMIGLSAQGVRARTELPLDQIDLSNAGLPPPLAVPLENALHQAERERILSTYSAGVIMPSYEIDFWGKVRAMDQAARDRYLASAEAQQSFRTALLALVTDSWLQGLELQERLQLARQTLANSEESHRIMRRRKEVGLISDMELRQTETLVASTRSDLATLERQVAANRALLTQLTHVSEVPRARTTRPLSRIEDRNLPAGLPSELLTRRPDIRAAELQLQAARGNVTAARKAFLPSITLTAGGGIASNALESLFSNNYGTWLFMPRISLPIFDGGRRQANLDLAEARKHQAVAQYESVIRNAFREVSELLAARHWLAVQERDVRQLLAAQADRAFLARRRYERGYSSYFEVLDAERSRFATEQSLVQLRRARLSSLVGLYKALGGAETQPLARPSSPSSPPTQEGTPS